MSYILIYGTLFYGIIKVLGYSLFAKLLNSLFSRENSIWKVGLIRTGLGIVLGFLHNAFFLHVLEVSKGRSPFGGKDAYLFFLLLVVLRIIEWGIIIFWFYDRKLENKAATFKSICLGIVWSFILDIPMIAGLIVVVSSIC